MTLRNFFNAGGHLEICLNRDICSVLNLSMFYHADSIESTFEMICELLKVQCSIREYLHNRGTRIEQFFEYVTFRWNGYRYIPTSGWSDFKQYICYLQTVPDGKMKYYLICHERLYGNW